MYTCLRGGNSSISEKLRLGLAPACRFCAIIGSTLIFGASTSGASTSGSTSAAEDMVADGAEDGPENDSTENVSMAASEALMTGAAKSRLGVMSPALAELAALPLHPATAAAALVAGGSVISLLRACGGVDAGGDTLAGAAGLTQGFGCSVAAGAATFTGGALAAGAVFSG